MEKITEKFNPLVSIIIPVYNGANYMREAIDSALAQTYKNIEVIVINDGSTDNTEEIAKSYGDKIRYFSKENGGVATALNLAIKNANGKYISWLSHDDVYYPEKIEKQIGILSDLNGNDRLSTIIMSNYSLINEKSEITSSQQFHKTHPLEKLNYPLYPLLKGIVHGCTLLIPRHCFEDVGYFDEKLKATQDYDLWFKMFPKYRMFFMPDLFVKSRWHAEQGSKKIATANQEADELWIKMIKNLTDEQKIAIDDSAMLFYQKTCDIVGGAGYSGAEKYLSKLMEEFKQRDISKIKVSIIVPFFNRIDWTAEAIRSVISQTHKNLEIIVINDSSTDNIEPINKLAGSDNRIKLINNKRKKGVSGARNTGIDNATGEYVAFLDSDDLFLPNKIEKQLEFMVRGGFLFSHTSYSFFDKFNKNKIINSGNTDMIYPIIMVNCFAATPTIMVHADIFRDKSNRFIEDYSIGEDTCLWVKISMITPSKGLSTILTKVRKHLNNAAYDKSKQIQGMGNILDYLISHLLNEETLEHIKNLNNVFIKMGGIDKNVSSKYNYQQNIFRCDNLQISDNDLIGNKFNGHDLHLYLKDNKVNSKQLVWNKESKDRDTFEIARNKHNRNEIYKNTQIMQKQYFLNGILNPLGYDILFDPLFINTELAHLHLIHNFIFDIQLLPLMTRLKPIVWTLHDPWALGGHCIHHFECEKWKSHCGDCSNLKVPFGLQTDNSALNFALKKDAIKNSNFEIIVASEWMKRKVEQSPIFEGKKINVVSFGINHEIFKPISKKEARKKLSVQEDALVISFRGDSSEFKGLDYIEYILKKIQTTKKVTLLVLKNKLRENPRNFDTKEYGWVKDDNLLAQIYSASDLFLMPSAMESFGMMAIEAMSCGTLPIVIDGTALPTVVNSSECGISTKRDKNEYLKAVQYYIDHENERNKRAKKCLEFANKNYNKDIYVKKIMEVYKEAIFKHKLSKEDQLLLEQLKKHIPTSQLSNTDLIVNMHKNKTIIFEFLEHFFKLSFFRKLIQGEKETLKKVLLEISPSFRMLMGNKQRAKIILEKVENLEKKLDESLNEIRNEIKK